MIKNCIGWISIVVIIITVGVIVWGILYYNQDPGAQQSGMGRPPAIPVEAERVHVGTATQEVTAVGSLKANESVIIRSEISGRISAIHFSEGQKIDKDGILIRIDPTEYIAQREQIAAMVELNRLNFERANQLYEEKLMSQQAYDEIAAKLKESEASLSLAQARLDKSTIAAPFKGRLGLRQVSPGDYVQPGQAIVNLEDIDSLKVDFRIPEIFLGQVKTGQTINVRVDAFPNKTFTGKIYAIDSRIDETTRTILSRARIPNENGKLRPGMFARVTLVLSVRANALLIPEQALVLIGEDKFVFRVVGGKASLTKVKIGQRRGGEVEIVEGLGVNDTVVMSGQMKIRDGAPVMILDPAGMKPEPSAGKES